MVLPCHDSERQPFCCHCLLLIKNYEVGIIFIPNFMQNSLLVLNLVNLVQLACKFPKLTPSNMVKLVHSSFTSKCIRQKAMHIHSWFLSLLQLIICSFHSCHFLCNSVTSAWTVCQKQRWIIQNYNSKFNYLICLRSILCDQQILDLYLTLVTYPNTLE